ncbi:MAG TPA: 4a-hydroxytetrahydrobiopterin dehydratase [Thermoanaerobaculia bacterium]|nr:4a-hydroxytetrahydrobiopterin dehydratase [Thermoanaerobaculia bacterium]
MAVTLYTRADCPLCEKAKEALRTSGVAIELTEVDIDADPELRARYTNDVPVIYVNGAEAFRHRVDPKLFASYVNAGLSGWRVADGHHLEKSYTFPDFAEALAFTNRLGALAEELNHHPDIHLGWGKVTVATWSHDAGRITERDFRLAAKIDQSGSS